MFAQQKPTKNLVNNKLAGFWIRLLGRGIDSIILAALTIGVGVANLKKIDGVVEFPEPWNFYLWVSVSIIIWPAYFILLPLLTNGYTLGSWSVRIKIKFEKKPLLEIVKRELFYSLLFSLNFTIIMIVINHTLVNKFFQMDQDGISYTTMESARIAVPTTFISMGMFSQMIVGITIIIKKGRGYNDTFSKSSVIYLNRFEKREVKNKNISKKYKPKLIELPIIEWIE